MMKPQKTTTEVTKGLWIDFIKEDNMKKTKKILALALAGMMAASALAGCSGSGGKEET